MKPKLPRALLWTEIETIDEFLKEPVNKEMYDLLLLAKNCYLAIADFEYSVLKVFNEVYYQCTRIEYEADPDIKMKAIKSDIKANLGLLNYAKVVYYMIYYLLSHRSNNSIIADLYKREFRRQVYSYLEAFGTDYHDKTLLRTRFHIDLHPRPVPPKQLGKMFLFWDEITNTFDKESIQTIIDLYDEKNDKFEILNIIEGYFKRYINNKNVNANNIRNNNPNMADSRFFFDQKYDDKSGDDGYSWMCAEDIIERPTYSQLEEENEILRKKLDEAISENESLKSALNMNKPKKQQETSFTLKLIVDYCKSIPDYTHVVDIERMLYKFIRKCTDKEEKLVDSISEYFNNKKYGDTVMGDKNEFKGNSGHYTIELPSGMTPQEAMKLLHNKTNDDDEEG